MYEMLESSVRDTFGSVVWSHKIQEKQADICSQHYKRLETMKIIAASITTVGIISLIFQDELWIKIAAAIVSLVSTFISAFFKSFDLKAMTSQHKQAANSLLEIRDELKLLLLQIHLQTEDEQALYNQYEALVRRLDTVYKDAPSTTEKAVGMARTALQISKDNDITDKEIDLSLPIALRKGAGKE